MATEPCTPVSPHDEDDDGVADSCDVCPHIGGAQLDSDGDRVGDACDPDPASPKQRIVVFDPFTTLASWNANATVSLRDDSVSLGGAGSQGSLRRAYVPAHDMLVVGGRTFAAGAGQHLVAILMKDTANHAFYCEVFDNGTNAMLFFTIYDGVEYTHPGFAPSNARLANGAGALAFFIDDTTAKCALTWASNTITATAPRPGDIAATTLDLYAENVEAELFYFIQIRTDP